MTQEKHLELELAISERRKNSKLPEVLIKNSGGKCKMCGKKATELHFIGKDLKCLMNYLFWAVCETCHNNLHEVK